VHEECVPFVQQIDVLLAEVHAVHQDRALSQEAVAVEARKHVASREVMCMRDIVRVLGHVNV
jgi:hypothetical protein